MRMIELEPKQGTGEKLLEMEDSGSTPSTVEIIN